jgi:hypothetical protein
MHHDNVRYRLVIDFRGEKAAICYEIHGPGTESKSFWLEDGRPWPEDLTPEEAEAIHEAGERDVCLREAADKPLGST